MNDRLREKVFEIFSGTAFTDSINLLTGNPSTGEFASAWNIILAIYNILLPIALLFMLIVFLQKMADQRNMGTTTSVQIFKEIFLAIIVYYVLSHGLELLAKLWGWGLNIANQASSTIVGGDPGQEFAQGVWNDMFKQFATDYNGDGVLDRIKNMKALGLLIGMYPFQILNFLTGLAMKAAAYALLFKLYIEFIMFPFSIPIMWQNGINSGRGFIFLKSFFVSVLQAALMVFTINIGQVILVAVSRSGIQGNYAVWCITYFSVQAAIVVTMFKTSEIAEALK